MNAIFLNYVNEKLIQRRKNKSGREFTVVLIPWKGSVSGWASMTVSSNQVYRAVRKDGTENECFKNVILGSPRKSRELQIKTDDGYETIRVANEAIASAFNAARNR